MKPCAIPEAWLNTPHAPLSSCRSNHSEVTEHCYSMYQIVDDQFRKACSTAHEMCLSPLARLIRAQDFCRMLVSPWFLLLGNTVTASSFRLSKMPKEQHATSKARP